MNIFQWCNHTRKVSIGGPGVIPSLPVPQPGLQAGLTRRSWREEEEGEGVGKFDRGRKRNGVCKKFRNRKDYFL